MVVVAMSSYECRKAESKYTWARHCCGIHSQTTSLEHEGRRAKRTRTFHYLCYLYLCRWLLQEDGGESYGIG